MDHRSFDRLARALGGASTRRGALAALAGFAAGAGLGSAGRDADAKKKRRKCDPACAAGQTCMKGACICDNGGSVCGANCCATGQRCESGACVSPPAQCIAAGEACKGVGRPCCAGTVCASGQAGQDDVACHVPAGGACQVTADCVYDATCTDGTCVANQRPRPVPAQDCTVCASGCPYATIEAAIAAAAPGAVITVAAGTYAPTPIDTPFSGGGSTDYLTIRRPVTLKACTAGENVVVSCPRENNAPQWFTNCLLVMGTQGVTLEGLTLQGPGGSNDVAGVLAGTSSAVVIRNCTITGCGTGIDSLATVSVAGTLNIPDGDLGMMADGGGFSITCLAGSSVTYPAAGVRCFTDNGGTITDCSCNG